MASPDGLSLVDPLAVHVTRAPRAADGLGEEIASIFRRLVDPTDDLVARVDRFREDLRVMEVRAQGLSSWQPQWSVVPIQHAFVGAVLGAYDPTRYTFYHAERIKEAFLDFVGGDWGRPAARSFP